MTRGTRRSRLHLHLMATMFLTLITVTGTLVMPAAAETAGEGPERLLPLRLGLLLPGTFSNPEAIDSDLVVGSAVAGYGPREWDDEFDHWSRPPLHHAAVWDITDPDVAPLDLGTLGGAGSRAVAVADTWVVGSAGTADGLTHAFAVDVAADDPTMLDLGTLPGHTNSWATAVDDGIMVGTSSDDRNGQAFAVDLKAAEPHMIPLGNLGGYSYAADVDNGIVVGGAWSPEDERTHVFAVDLNSPTPSMRDLGHLGGDNGSPTRLAIDGGIVVGSMPALQSSNHAFVVDLTAGDATMRDLHFGALRTESWPMDVANGVVVGNGKHHDTGKTFGFVYDVATGNLRQFDRSVVDVDSAGTAIATERDSDGERRAFVFDANDPEPEFHDRGVLVSADGTEPNPVDEQVLVGTIIGRAAVWPIGETVRVHRSSLRVHESAGAVRVRVLRTGDLTGPASVHYRTKGSTARPDVDFASMAGTLSFVSGQSEATIRIPVRDDSRPEPVERFTVHLTEPSAGQRLLTSEATVTLRESDQRPDLEVSSSARGRYLGNDVHNGSADQQTVAAPVRRGGTRSFYVRLHNDGNAAITTTLRPKQDPSGVRVLYTHAGEDITKAVTGHGGWKVTVRPGHRVRVRLEVEVSRTLRPGTGRTVKVAAMWAGDVTRRDVVGSKVQIRR